MKNDSPVRVVVVVRHGMVTSVYANGEINLDVVDLDNVECSCDDEYIDGVMDDLNQIQSDDTFKEIY